MGAPVVGKLTRWTEKALNPAIGKSFVAYATKPRTGEPAHADVFAEGLDDGFDETPAGALDGRGEA